MDEWIRQFLEQYGSFGVGLLMLIENVFPPIPSELVMPWAGYAVSQNNLSFVGAVSAGSIGSFAGALFWYWLARHIGAERLAVWADRHGAWLTLTRRDLDRTEKWFDRWGSTAVLACRLVPGLRTLISIPAGFSKMPIGRFTAFTAVGTVLWTLILAAIGWWLGDNYADLSGPLSWISTLVVGGLFAIWFYRLLRQHKRHQHARDHG